MGKVDEDVDKRPVVEDVSDRIQLPLRIYIVAISSSKVMTDDEMRALLAVVAAAELRITAIQRIVARDKLDIEKLLD